MKPDVFESGAVCVENLDDGQGSILRELAANGFVVGEIHDHGFYIRKLKADLKRKTGEVEQ